METRASASICAWKSSIASLTRPNAARASSTRFPEGARVIDAQFRGRGSSQREGKGVLAYHAHGRGLDVDSQAAIVAIAEQPVGEDRIGRAGFQLARESAEQPNALASLQTAS